MDELYFRYFARLAKFFENMTGRADLVEELTNDTMLEVWKGGKFIRTNTSVLIAIMRLAYSRLQKYLTEARTNEPHSQSDVREWEQSKLMRATATASYLQVFLSKLPVEERAVVHLV